MTIESDFTFTLESAKLKMLGKGDYNHVLYNRGKFCSRISNYYGKSLNKV